MLDPVVPSDRDTKRLRTLLEESTAGLDDPTLAEAISLGPDVAGDLVAALVDGELRRPTGANVAIRAVHLARELRLARAIPPLVRCVERLHEFDPLRRAAIVALPVFGAAAVDALVAALLGGGKAARLRLAEALAAIPGEDDRVRPVLVRVLREEPQDVARWLAERGDSRAIPELSRVLDRLVAEPVADCAICQGEHLTAIASAIQALGGTLTKQQMVDIEDVLERARDQWIPFDATPVAGLGRRAVAPPHVPRPGRNDPCHCGSGKKYKRCHLAQDERSSRH